MTEIYLIRHSEPLKNLDYTNSKDNFQMQNEKRILTVNGELKALKLSHHIEMQNIDIIISSNYSRAISTAKYTALNNQKEIIIMDEFKERIYGDIKGDIKEFEINQILNENLKFPNGESRNEVVKRINQGLNKVLNNHKNKRIAIFSHATAITFILMYLIPKYNLDKSIIPGINYKWNAPEIFKLTFNEKNELIKALHIPFN